MKQIIIGTAGHNDHGKTSIVKSLTGLNTDVQKNEIITKQRQIEKQVDALNGEINAYNKIEPPVQDAPNEAPETDD